MSALALVVGAVAGFLGSRALRRPSRAVPTTSVARSGSGPTNPRPRRDAPVAIAKAAATSAPPKTRAATGAFAIVRSDTGEEIVLGDEPVTIGRSRDQVVSIDDSRVSRAHARIERRGSGWALRDEGSANGTRVGGEKLPAGRPCPLQAGDVIALGEIELRVTATTAGFFPPGRDDQR